MHAVLGAQKRERRERPPLTGIDINCILITPPVQVLENPHNQAMAHMDVQVRQLVLAVQVYQLVLAVHELKACLPPEWVGVAEEAHQILRDLPIEGDKRLVALSRLFPPSQWGKWGMNGRVWTSCGL